jgi:hypothetical protein
LFTGYFTSFIFSGLRASAIKQTKAFLLPLRLRKVFRTIKELK